MDKVLGLKHEVLSLIPIITYARLSSSSFSLPLPSQNKLEREREREDCLGAYKHI